MKKSILLILVLALYCAINASVLFVLNSGSETLSRIDTDSGQIDNAFAVLGSMPNRMECNSEFIYVVNSGDNSLQKINAATGSTVDNLYLGTSVNPYDLLLNDDKLYISGGLSHQVYKVDLNTFSLSGQVTVGNNPAGMAVKDELLFVGNTDYITNYANCSVSIIDLQTFEVINTVPTSANPQYLMVRDDFLHVSCGGNWADISGSVQIMDISQQEIVHTIDFAAACGDFACSPNGTVYVAEANNSAVFAYNADSWDVIYSPASPFTPGGSVVQANDQFLAVLGGIWGQNFTLHLFDLEENSIADYTAGLYGTDVKFLPEISAVQQDNLIPVPRIVSYPNPFSSCVNFSLQNCREDISNISIYDIRGRLVKNICAAEAKSWDGFNDNNVPAAAGIYLSKITTANGNILSSRIIKFK